MAHINVRSLTPKCAEVYDIIKSEDLDMLAITETWQHSNYDDSLYAAAPDGYSFASEVRTWQRGYGGVAVYYRSTMQVERMNVNRTPLETLVLKIKYLRSELILVCIYKAPAFKDTATLNKIDSMLKEVRSLDLPVVITGDINIHVDDPSDFQTSCLNHSLAVTRMVQHITPPTHSGGHTLDIVISKNVDITNISVEPPWLSDHGLVIWTGTIKEEISQVYADESDRLSVLPSVTRQHCI